MYVSMSNSNINMIIECRKSREFWVDVTRWQYDSMY